MGRYSFKKLRLFERSSDGRAVQPGNGANANATDEPNLISLDIMGRDDKPAPRIPARSEPMNHKSSIHHSKACQKTWPVIALFLAWSSKLALPQGCIPAHYISLNLDAQGISYLNPGQWEADVSYRYLHSERVFSGSDEQPQLHGVGGRN